MCAVVACAALGACNDALAPPAAGTTIVITAVEDSVFEGDTVRLTARVLDETGTVDPNASVAWTVDDRALADVVGEGVIALLRPGTVRLTARSGTAAATYELVIAPLVVRRVELTPDTIRLGRTDRVSIGARVVGQGERVITGRTVAFASDDTLVAIVPGPVSRGSPDIGLLIAVGSGSATIRATVDGVAGAAHVQVVDLDTTFTLIQYEGSPLPVLVAADSVTFDGVREFDEVYVDTGTFVLSGLLQKRYALGVRYSQYHVFRVGDTVQRELRFRSLGEHDLGSVTVGANGDLSMLSEFIGPHLEHSATLQDDGYLVHYRIPGENAFLDLRYRRSRPGAVE